MLLPCLLEFHLWRALQFQAVDWPSECADSIGWIVQSRVQQTIYSSLYDFLCLNSFWICLPKWQIWGTAILFTRIFYWWELAMAIFISRRMSPGDTEYNQVCKRLTLTSINVYHAKTAQDCRISRFYHTCQGDNPVYHVLGDGHGTWNMSVCCILDNASQELRTHEFLNKEVNLKIFILLSQIQPYKPSLWRHRYPQAVERFLFPFRGVQMCFCNVSVSVGVLNNWFG